MGEWNEVAFGDLLPGGTRNGIYKPKEFHGRGAKIVNMGELFAYPRLRDVPMKRVVLTESELKTATIQAGDLLFARRSLVAEGAGKCSIVVDVNEPTTFESSIIRARPESGSASSLFLYYFFNSPRGRYQLGTILRQVAVSGITGSDLVKLKLPLPPLTIQRRIAHILGTLDDKIELNRRMNRTLEKMAAAMFKSWFIDFDPVRRNAARARNQPSPPAPLPVGEGWPTGRGEGSVEAFDRMFPDAFDNSDRGPIPRGWKVGSLGDVANSPRRGVNPSDVPPTTPYIGLEHMPRRCIALDAWGRAEDVASGKSQFKQGEILFGKLRPYFHKVGIAPMDGVCSTDIVVVTPKSQDWHGYVLSLVSSKAFVDYTDSHSAGTKMPRTNWKDMSRYPLALPPQCLAKAFQNRVADCHRRIMLNVRQNRRLAGLRDTLLPKLMSGEIAVPAAEAVTEGLQ